jgi:CcmD family protein
MVASNQSFIIAAYAVTWIVMLGYLWRLARNGRRARDYLERMANGHSGENGQ